MINIRQAKKYCKEDISKIENFDKAMNDKTQTWVCHHRTEIWWNCSQKDLIANECYYDRKALELIFLTHSEHDQLHKTGKLRGPMSDEQKQKIANSQKGHTVSDATKRKISAAKKGHAVSDETKRKLSEAKVAYYAARRKEGDK